MAKRSKSFGSGIDLKKAFKGESKSEEVYVPKKTQRYNDFVNHPLVPKRLKPVLENELVRGVSEDVLGRLETVEGKILRRFKIFR